MAHPSVWCGLVFLGCSMANPGRGQDPPPTPGVANRDLLHRIFAPPRPVPLDPAMLAGLPSGTWVEVLTWERVYKLALIRARTPQPPRFAGLDAARLAEEAQRVGWADFARLRADLAPGTKFRDPAADFLSLQARLAEIRNLRALAAWHETWTQNLKEMINGEASGIHLSDLDRASSATAQAQRSLDRSVARFRDGLDDFEVALGLAPGAAVSVDTSGLAAFSVISDDIARWSLSPQRSLADLDAIVGRYPALGDVTIDGRSILADLATDPGRLGAILDRATRLAIDHHHATGAAADAVALRVRHAVRHLAEVRADYLLELRQAVLTARLLDDGFEQIIAPPSGPPPAGPANRFIGLAAAADQDHATRTRLVTLWTTFRAERLAIEADLGIFPFDDWPGFLGQFAAEARPPAPPAAAPGEPIVPARIPDDPIMPVPFAPAAPPVRVDPQPR